MNTKLRNVLDKHWWSVRIALTRINLTAKNITAINNLLGIYHLEKNGKFTKSLFDRSMEKTFSKKCIKTVMQCNISTLMFWNSQERHIYISLSYMYFLKPDFLLFCIKLTWWIVIIHFLLRLLIAEILLSFQSYRSTI